MHLSSFLRSYLSCLWMISLTKWDLRARMIVFRMSREELHQLRPLGNKPLLERQICWARQLGSQLELAQQWHWQAQSQVPDDPGLQGWVLLEVKPPKSSPNRSSPCMDRDNQAWRKAQSSMCRVKGLWLRLTKISSRNLLRAQFSKFPARTTVFKMSPFREGTDKKGSWIQDPWGKQQRMCTQWRAAHHRTEAH